MTKVETALEEYTRIEMSLRMKLYSEITDEFINLLGRGDNAAIFGIGELKVKPAENFEETVNVLNVEVGKNNVELQVAMYSGGGYSTMMLSEFDIDERMEILRAVRK